MTIDALCERYPHVFHMADARNRVSIETFGLRSSEALCKHLALSDQETFEIISKRRPQTVEYKGAFFRDQRPISDSKLASCLRGRLSSEEWYRKLNERIFFWLSHARLHKFRQVYSGEKICVLEISTRELVELCSEHLELSPINSGATRMPNHFRDATTFCPVLNYDLASRPKPVELTVRDRVIEIGKLSSARWLE